MTDLQSKLLRLNSYYDKIRRSELNRLSNNGLGTAGSVLGAAGRVAPGPVGAVFQGVGAGLSIAGSIFGKSQQNALNNHLNNKQNSVINAYSDLASR